jgi:hypothetical protein
MEMHHSNKQQQPSIHLSLLDLEASLQASVLVTVIIVISSSASHVEDVARLASTRCGGVHGALIVNISSVNSIL